MTNLVMVQYCLPLTKGSMGQNDITELWCKNSILIHIFNISLNIYEVWCLHVWIYFILSISTIFISTMTFNRLIIINNYQSACPILPFEGVFVNWPILRVYKNVVSKISTSFFKHFRASDRVRVLLNRKILVLRSYLSQKTYFGKTVTYFLLSEGGSMEVILQYRDLVNLKYV